ncbi:hypothetical protein [Rhodoplanes roseus]|uniref:hypothetical protein n=1 Tax=Rhodoplanes roseus TaxID=29409 RepID=UPI00315C4BE3
MAVERTVLGDVERADTNRLAGALKRGVVLEGVETCLIPDAGAIPQDRRPGIAVRVFRRTLSDVAGQTFLVCFS